MELGSHHFPRPRRFPPRSLNCPISNQQAPRIQQSVSQAPHGLHSSRRAVVIQHPHAPATRVGRPIAPHQRAFHIHGAPSACRTVISRHPTAQMSPLAASESLLKLARKHQNLPVNSPNVRRSRHGGTRFAPAYVLDRIVPSSRRRLPEASVVLPPSAGPEHGASRACPAACPGLRPELGTCPSCRLSRLRRP